MSNYIYPQAVALIVLSIFAAFLNIGPFIWHFKARNIPACCLVFWVILLNTFNFINAIIWHNDNTDTWWQGHGYCDVESKLVLASNVGTCGALLCILRSLTMVLNTKNTALTASDVQKRNDKIVMLVFCWAFPIYIMAVHYVVQSERYFIYGIAGCLPVADPSWPTDVLILIWPLVLTFVDAFYAVLLVIRMQRYRSEFTRLLSLSQTTKSRFLRLFVLSAIFILALMPLQIYSFYGNHSRPRHAYSWNGIHGGNWGFIFNIPSGGQVPPDRWVYVVLAFLVFTFFGTGSDALAMYRGWMVQLRILPPVKPGAKSPSYFLGGRWSSLVKSLVTKSTGKSMNATGSESPEQMSYNSITIPEASNHAADKECSFSTTAESEHTDIETVTSNEFFRRGEKNAHDMV